MRYLLTIILCSLLAGARGQEYSFKHYKADNGLSYNTVFCSLQDSRGFMWFGTLDGLNRFDGYNFKVYRNNPADKRSIGNNVISALHEDKQGNIWVGTHNGLYRFNAITEDFELFLPSYSTWVSGITHDRDGNLWFFTGGDLCRYTASTKKLKVFTADKLQPTTLASNNSGEIWFATGAGQIAQYNKTRNNFAIHNVYKHSPYTETKQVTKIYADSSLILIGTRYQGIKVFDKKTLTYRDVLNTDGQPINVYTHDILKTGKDTYWFATHSGILVYNSQTGRISTVEKNNADEFSLSDNNINTLCKDNQGGIWVGTNFGGINYYSKANTIFDRFRLAGNNLFNGNIVGQINTGTGGNLWMGTEDEGLYHLNTSNNVFNRYALPYNNITSVLQVGTELWIGKLEEGLEVIDMNTRQVLRRYREGRGPHDLRSNFITCLYKTRKGQIYAGTSGGIYIYDVTTRLFNRIATLPDPFASSILEDDKENLWIGTYFSGVFHLDTHTGKGRMMPVDFSNEGRNNNTVTSICQDSDGQIWFSSESGGIGKFDQQTFKLQKYTVKNGFPNNNTFKILEDNHKTLWISASKGIIQFDPRTRKTQVFTKANGLVSDQFNVNSGYKDNTGKLYFGGTEGLVAFTPGKGAGYHTNAPLFITGIEINNHDVAVSDSSPLKRSVIFTDKIRLNYKQSSISIDFASLAYPFAHMVNYRYKLDGVDTRWTALEGNRKVYFTNLAPGTYTFRIKASAPYAGIKPAEKTLQIVIAPPIWKNNWAIAFYISLAAAAGYYLIIRYHRKLERENKRKFDLLEVEKDKKIYESKIDFFTNIAHEIRTPLTLITAPLENIRHTDDLDEIRYNARLMDKNAGRLLNLTNQLLDFRKSEMQGYRLSFVKTDMAAILLEMFSRFALIAEQSKLKFTIDIKYQPLFVFADADAVDKILSNIISNAIKYAATKVHMVLDKNSEDAISVTVENDGYLIPANLKEKIFEPFYRVPQTDKKAGTGIGLALARSLAELHHGNLVLEPDNSVNKFCLSLPVHQDNEFDLAVKEPEPEIPEIMINDWSKPVILIVEDNPDLINFISHDLGADYAVLNAANGKQAIEVLHKNTVQLIVSDVMMPVMDGFALCKHVKTDIELSHIPLILLTAKSTIQAKIEGLETGADAYLDKPFSTQHLKAQIASLLFNRHKLQQYFAGSPLTAIGSMAQSKADEQFLEKLNATILQHITDPDLDIAMLAGAMNMSRTNLFRKIKAVSDLTPAEIINIMRLKRAAELIQQNENKLYEIADMVGFKSRIVFTRNFSKQFGMSPSEFIKNAKKVAEENL